MRSREYRALRAAGLLAASKYRARLRECDRILEMGVSLESAPHWIWSREDWARRLHTERLLLASLRGPDGSIPRWRSTVIALRPRGTERLAESLDDLPQIV